MSKIDPEAQKRADTKRTTGLPTEAAYWATPTSSDNSNRTTKIAPSHGISHGLVLAGQAASWATPKANDSEKRGNVAHRPHMPELVGQAQAWPTPKGTDGTKGGPNQAGSKGDLMLPSAAAQWPTPRTTDTNQGRGAELIGTAYYRPSPALKSGILVGQANLSDVVQQWPTPAARDSKGANSAEHALITGGGRKHMDQLSNFVAHSLHLAQPIPDGQESSPDGPGSPRRLNPAFGCWLMGLPCWWTNPGLTSFARSETDAYRSRLQQHLSCLFDEHRR